MISIKLYQFYFNIDYPDLICLQNVEVARIEPVTSWFVDRHAGHMFKRQAIHNKAL